MNATHQTTNKKAVTYVRVSTKEQVDEGNSLNTQQRMCNDYASKHNYDVVETFVEQGESAKTVDRTELQRLLMYCADKKHGVKAIIIYKLDRLSRNTDDYSQLRLLLKRHGVEIKSTSEHFENNPVGRFLENTMANIAQFDNDIRAERCIGGMREAMREGRYVWMSPIGYKNIKVAGKATIGQDEKNASIIKYVFELIAQNAHSIDEVRILAEERGLINKKGKPVCRAYFYVMLTNEIYAGWTIKFGERYKGLFEPIISEETFNQVQRILKQKGKKHAQHLRDNPDFPLRRFVVNNEGKKITGSWCKGRLKYYPFYRFGGINSNYNRDKFEIEFMQYLNQFRFDDAKLKKLKEFVQVNFVQATQNQRKEAEWLTRHINELMEKQTGIIKKNLNGFIPDNVLKQQLEMIDKELFDANTSLAEIPNKDIDFMEVLKFLNDYLKNPGSVWQKAKIEVKLKIQWFQFPQGLTFQNNVFGTKEIRLLFKPESTFLPIFSSIVHSGFKNMNTLEMPNKIECDQIKKELCYMYEILHDIS